MEFALELKMQEMEFFPKKKNQKTNQLAKHILENQINQLAKHIMENLTNVLGVEARFRYTQTQSNMMTSLLTL
jgi:hypothetical protein